MVYSELAERRAMRHLASYDRSYSARGTTAGNLQRVRPTAIPLSTDEWLRRFGSTRRPHCERSSRFHERSSIPCAFHRAYLLLEMEELEKEDGEVTALLLAELPS